MAKQDRQYSAVEINRRSRLKCRASLATLTGPLRLRGCRAAHVSRGLAALPGFRDTCRLAMIGRARGCTSDDRPGRVGSSAAQGRAAGTAYMLQRAAGVLAFAATSLGSVAEAFR